MKKVILILSFFLNFTAFAIEFPPLLAFPEASMKNLNAIKKNKVLVFLNRSCPCTQKNIPYINELVKKYQEIEFIGVHSVKNGKTKEIEEIRELYKSNFVILEDHELKMANLLKANRTPQVFILSATNDILYSGGITDRTDPSKASAFYLLNALNEVVENKNITQKETRSLGCIILR